MNFNFSDRVGRIEPSMTSAISNLASKPETQGEDVVDLSVGVSDFPTPDNITQAMKDALDTGHTSYTSLNGIPELKEAIAAKLRGDDVGARANGIIVTPGGKQVLFKMSQTFVDDGDEVVPLDLAWVSYEVMVKLADGTLSHADPVQHDSCLELTLDKLVDTVSDETKLLVVNNPSNPTGSVFSDVTLEGVRGLAVEHNIAIISDEIYERIVCDDFEHTSFSSLDGAKDRTITVDGFPEAFSMTDWRLGYLHAPSNLIAQTGKLHSHLVSYATNFVQHVGVEALSERTDDNVEEMRQVFEDCHSMLANLLAKHDVDVAVPKDALHMVLLVGGDDQTWCEGAIQDAKAVTAPRSAFSTPGYARTSYIASEECLREAVEHLAGHDYI